MQHKADLREFVEALMTLAHSPISLVLGDLGKQQNGMRIGEFISTYEGLKDGEFLGILSSLFGLSFSSGKAHCNGGVGSGLSDLLNKLYSSFADPEAKQDLLDYLDVKQLSSPEVFYWKQRLGSLSHSELTLVRALVRLQASADANARSVKDIAAEARKMQADLDVNETSLEGLAHKMPVVKEGTKYYLSIERWQIFQGVLATLQSGNGASTEAVATAA
jgi:hypothetical protein